ncbi:MAG: CbiX/SirB N-terminal domain-containing protein [Burkholderiales bacterium]
MTPPLHGILLFAHGARDPAWARPFEAIAAQMRAAAPDCRIALAYLELMHPSLDEAARLLIGQGCTALTVVPLFLGAGGHVRRDLPERVAALQAAFPHITLRATSAIGEADSVVRALALAALELARSTQDEAP